MSAQQLPPNQPPDRFYRGGAQIDRFRGAGSSTSRQPEDWIASTTAVAGKDLEGLTMLDDGTSLRSAVQRDPTRWLSAPHRRAHGDDPMLLVKLLDAGQRLPVHAHPHADFALDRLGCAHGKAEAWYILQGGTVHLGLTEDIDPTALADMVATQDDGALLARLNEVQVAEGDVVYVAPGVLHAIGKGVLILEVQEPEDLSILLEWRGFDLDGERDGHLGLGFDTALRAVDHRALDAAGLAAVIHRAGDPSPLLPPEAGRYFRLERRTPDDGTRLEGGFAVAVVVTGSPSIGGEHLNGGSVLLLDAVDPWLAVVWGGTDGEIVVARPPSRATDDVLVTGSRMLS